VGREKKGTFEVGIGFYEVGYVMMTMTMTMMRRRKKVWIGNSWRPLMNEA